MEDAAISLKRMTDTKKYFEELRSDFAELKALICDLKRTYERSLSRLNAVEHSGRKEK